MQKTWKQYRDECLKNNVEPTRADFKGVERTWEQIDAHITRSMKQPMGLGASAGL